MGNRHFARIGDVWKHLALAEVLAVERPAAYWETHAGPAAYPLTHSPERDHGAWFFHGHASEAPDLARSQYAGLLREMVAADQPLYPGSPLIAMRLLGPDPHAHFLFCDRDPHSLTNIAHHARGLDIPPARLDTREADGVAAVAAAAAQLSPERRRDLVVHLDPDDLSAASTDPTPAALFAALARDGVRCLLWWGAGSRDEAGAARASLRSALVSAGVDPAATPVWAGDVTLAAIDHTGGRRPDAAGRSADPGVLACGVLGANLSPESTARCGRLGRALADLYRHATFPDGSAGSMEFQEFVMTE